MALYLVGLALSTAWTGWCLPRIGDRRTLVVGMTAAVAGCIAVAFSGGWIPGLLLGRFVHGLGAGAVFVVLPYMIAGRSPEAIRGRLGVFFQLMVTAGLALGSAVGLAATRFLASESAWRADYLASVPFAVLVGFLALRLPKSVPHSAPVAQPAADGVRARPSARVLLAVAIPALVPGELLPEESCSWGLALAALGSHVASCAVVAAYQPAARAFGPGAVLCAFSCLSAGSTVLFACLLPETRAGRRQEPGGYRV
ncbi:MAG: sugar porter family MFS transporter [Lentisphaerae bacterium]|nr:sugar porter family MFS transporter [Lentisphaerota bacterium]